MLCGDSSLDLADMPRVINVPERCLGCGAERRGTVCRNECLGRHVLQLFHKDALAIWLQATFHFVHDGDGRLTLILFRDGQSSEATRTGSPTGKRQCHRAALRR